MPGKSNPSKPLMLTDRPWSELESLSPEVRMSGAYRLVPSIRELVIAPPRSLMPPLLRSGGRKLPSPITQQLLAAADPKLLHRRFLVAGAPAVSVERQTPATLGDAKKRKIGKSAFDNDRDSYFVLAKKVLRRSKTVQLCSLVLGWNHAALLRRTDAGYIVQRLYCHSQGGDGHKAFGLLDKLELLPRVGKPIVDERRGTWKMYKPPPLPLERVVTYGVSSCSFTVLFTLPDAEFIAVSHMSGGPPIPVGLMMEELVDETDELQLIASILPQSVESMKFDEDVIFSEKLKVHSLIMSRGKKPTRDEGLELFPQMGHSDIGISFLGKGPPCIEGNLGVGQDLDYWTLIPLSVAFRLRALCSPDGMGSSLLFKCGKGLMSLAGGPAPVGVRQVFADRGHPLDRKATITVVKFGVAWKLQSGRRVFMLEVVKNDLNVRCETEPFDIGNEVVGPLLAGEFGFPQVHRAIRDGFMKQVQGAVGSFKGYSYFHSKTPWEVIWETVLLDYRESKNAARAFARLLGSFLALSATDHPLRDIVAKVMKANRYAIDIPLVKIDRL